MKIDLNKDAKQSLTFQSYDRQPDIDGVTVISLKKHRSLEGSFMEYIRITDGMIEGIKPEFELRQTSISWAVPERINAFHVHPKEIQNEIWTVVDGALLVWLVDVRADSPTNGARKNVYLSGENPSQLYIPAGVAHGYKAGLDGAVLIYSMDSQFNINDPNEGRLPWDFFGTDLWEDDRG
ncbi:MAG: dTDP-4-dehydrorhamnose 3,5-epimerase family protein [Armatimonadota bacterium]